MKPRAIVTVTALCALFVFPAGVARAEHPPLARAWVVKVSLPSPVGDVLRVADTSALAGGDPVASALALDVLGHTQSIANATKALPDASQVFKHYDDPTNSISIDGGFANAHVTDASSTARAGFAAINGSGFALANKFFTFDQQAQLLAMWKQLNDQLVGPVNTILGTVGGVTGVLGITLPPVTGIPPTGLINVATIDQVVSSSTTSSSPGYSTAKASSAGTDVNLFDGFIQIRGIKAEAESSSIGGVDTRHASATFAAISIAGLPVEITGDGISILGNQLLPASLLRPVMDLLLGVLKTAGITIHTGEEVADGDMRSASALEISIASPAGPVLISVGHAEARAAAASVLGEQFSPPPRAPHVSTPVTPVSHPVTITHHTPAVITAAAAPPAIAPLTGGWPPAVSRALRTIYLIVVFGGLLVSIGPIPFIRRARRARRPRGATT